MQKIKYGVYSTKTGKLIEVKNSIDAAQEHIEYIKITQKLAGVFTENSFEIKALDLDSEEYQKFAKRRGGGKNGK